jgi:hypothetical protein
MAVGEDLDIECQTCAPSAAFTHSVSFNYRLEGDGSEHADTKVSCDLPDKVTIVAFRPRMLRKVRLEANVTISNETTSLRL